MQCSGLGIRAYHLSVIGGVQNRFELRLCRLFHVQMLFTYGMIPVLLLVVLYIVGLDHFIAKELFAIDGLILNNSQLYV